MLKQLSFSRKVSAWMGRRLAGLPVEPDMLTVLGMVLAALGYLAWEAPPDRWTAFLLFGFAFLLDGIDGAVARAKKKATAKGAFLDGISDRIVEFFLLLALIQVTTGSEQLALVIILFFGTAMTGYVKAYAEHSGVLKHEKAVKMPGMLERTERGTLLLILLALAILRMEDVFAWVVYATAALSLLTFLQRFGRVYFAK